MIKNTKWISVDKTKKGYEIINLGNMPPRDTVPKGEF